MAKPFEPKIVSANDLLMGDVVYLDRSGTWTRRLRVVAAAPFPDVRLEGLESPWYETTLPVVVVTRAWIV